MTITVLINVLDYHLYLSDWTECLNKILMWETSCYVIIPKLINCVRIEKAYMIYIWECCVMDFILLWNLLRFHMFKRIENYETCEIYVCSYQGNDNNKGIVSHWCWFRNILDGNHSHFVKIIEHTSRTVFLLNLW